MALLPREAEDRGAIPERRLERACKRLAPPPIAATASLIHLAFFWIALMTREVDGSNAAKTTRLHANLFMRQHPMLGLDTCLPHR
jgi:hypothetical protein